MIGVAAVLVLIVAVVLVAPSFIDWNRYKTDLAAYVEQATGRRLDIAGDLSLRLLPAPTLAARDVTFANAPEGSDQPMVRMEELAVRVAFGPLLGGRVQVESVRLVRPQVVLEILPDGRGNWVFDQPPAEAPAAGGPMPPPPGSEAPQPAPGSGAGGGTGDGLAVALDRVTIEDGSLLWGDAAAEELHLDAIDGDIAAGSLQGPFEGDLATTLRGSRITAALRTGRLPAGEGTTPLTLTLGVPDAGGSAVLQGRIGGLTAGGTPAFEGTVTADSPSLARTLAAVQGVEPTAPLDRPFRLAATVAAGPERVALDGMTLRLGETEGSGGASLTLADPPRVDAALAFTRIDLDALLREARAPAATDVAAAPAAVSPGQAVAAEPPPVTVPGAAAPAVAQQPLIPALPPSLTGSVDITADVITWRGGVVRAAAVSASLANGEVTVNQADALLPGSSEVHAFGFIDTRSDPARLDGTLEVRSNNLRGLLDWVGVEAGEVPAARLRDFAITAALLGTAADLAVPSLEGMLDTTRFQGAAAVRPMQARPTFGLSLSVDALNVDAYLPRQAAAAGGGTAPTPAPGGQAPAAPAGQGGGGGQPAGAPPLLQDLAVLNTFDANIKASAGTLTWQGREVRGARLDVTVQDGKATFGETVVENLAGSRLGLGGTLTGFGGAPRFEGLTLTLDSQDPAPLARLFDLDLPEAVAQAAPLGLSATLTGDLTRLGITTASRLAGGTLTAEGAVADPLGTPALDLTLAVNHENMVALLRRFGLTYEPQGGRDIGPFALAGKLTGSTAAFTLSDMTLRAGPSTLSGQMAVDTTGEVPAVVARLPADRLPVTTFLPAERRAAVDRLVEAIVPAAFAAAPGLPAAPGAAVEPAQAAGGAPRWSSEPMDLAALSALRLDLALTARDLSYDRWRLTDADLSARIADGALTVPQLTGALFGGPFSLQAALAGGRSGTPALDLTAAVQQMDIGAALEALQGDRAARGRLDFRTAVKASGASERALVSSLTGDGSLSLAKVDMRRADSGGGSALAAVLAPLRALDRLAGAVGGDSYGVDVRADFVVADGIVQFFPERPLTISSNLYNGSMAGRASLPDWTVEAAGEVRLAQNALTALLGTQVRLPEVMPVALSGPLDRPNVKVGTGRQGDTAAPARPEDILRDTLRQALPGAAPPPADGGGTEQPQQQDQPAPKPEKVLRDTLKNLLLQQ
ncbi:AsmA family protein [Caenispirillum bisanense]